MCVVLQIFNPLLKFCLWALMSAINVSVTSCQLPTCKFSAFGKKAIHYFIEPQTITPNIPEATTRISVDTVSNDFSDIISNLLDSTTFNGNNLTLRSAYLPSGAFKSWIDVNVSLSPGWLKNFYFYTHNFHGDSLGDIPESVNFRLQIWDPTRIPVNEQRSFANPYHYELLWEFRVTNLNVTSETGKLWEVRYNNVKIFKVALGASYPGSMPGPGNQR